MSGTVTKRPTHGGNVHEASRILRKPLNAIVDFSASVNPLGPSKRILRALADMLPVIRHYPDPECSALRHALGVRFNLPADWFVVGNGSSELIDMVPRALSIRSAAIAGPAFSEYAAAVEKHGGRSTLLSAKRIEQYRPSCGEIVRWIRSRKLQRRGVDAVFVCQPNSPTGQIWEQEELETILRAAHRARVWTILDETFAEYCSAVSIVPRLRHFPLVVVLRSFTKFYAIPGLRIGYSISCPSTAERIRRLQPPWSVNVLAQHAAIVSMQDRGYMDRSLAFMLKERPRFMESLASIGGLTVFDSHANFVMIELPPGWRADAVTMMLGRKGILIRDCSQTPGLNGRTIRLAVRTSLENDRLVRLLRKTLRIHTNA